MKLAIEWNRPIPLSKSQDRSRIYEVDLEKISTGPGIYIFARHWGKSYEALYVGQSKNLQSRIKGHLNNLKLMRHVENAKNGSRVLIVGKAATKPGQQISSVLNALEKALIRHFLSEAHDLVNKQGVQIRRHEIESMGGVPKAFIPSLMYLESK
jgi:hypothetical protein